MPKVIIVLLLFLLIIGTSNYVYGDRLFEEQEYKKLVNIADSKVSLINDFLEQTKDDATFLSETQYVKDIFKMNLTISDELMSKKIKNIADNTRYNVDEFIINHPEMTAEDLQKSSEFREIAINDVGETGYTFVLNTNTFTN